ncbi:ERG4/ERG24 ergosterol biosynthesis protein [Aspergillus karnatakaensis]|uniref:ERG4/ERG24 ergosterol biosynthesis protein n=1 Tax=Aspergillus karnatakaensis TaxID=1810916 RepID=UPI003CCDC259
MSVSTISEYEFGGRCATVALTFGLPILLYGFAFDCNDSTGCPAFPPSEEFKEGLSGLFDFKVLVAVLAYYLLTLGLWRVLPAQEVHGTKLVHHDRALKYRLNALKVTSVYLLFCGIGTYTHGDNFFLWTYIADHYVQIYTTSLLISYILSLYLYTSSLTVDTQYPNRALRELAPAGNTKSPFYNFFIGRELNPRATLPFFGEVDFKSWCGMSPGLTGWLLLDLAFMAKQYRNYGFVSTSMLFVTAIQSYYVLEGQYNEVGFLTMRDITTDGLGFMLVFGDLVWVPFLYSTQTRYLATYPTPMSGTQLCGLSLCFVVGLYIFRASNGQKIFFRTRPDESRVVSLSYIKTRRGTKLLTSGWWGVARHINYVGDWLQSFPFCLATGLAGYVVTSAGGGMAAG